MRKSKALAAQSRHSGWFTMMAVSALLIHPVVLSQNGTSALHAAVLSGNIKTVALLLEAGADPALRNKVLALSYLPLNSMRHQHKEIKQHLLKPRQHIWLLSP